MTKTEIEPLDSEIMRRLEEEDENPDEDEELKCTWRDCNHTRMEHSYSDNCCLICACREFEHLEKGA